MRRRHSGTTEATILGVANLKLVPDRSTLVVAQKLAPVSWSLCRREMRATTKKLVQLEGRAGDDFT